MRRSVDPVLAEVVAHHLLRTSEEMGAALIRSSFSPNIKERADCSTAIFDSRGAVIAQAQMVPLHLGSMIGTVEAIEKRIGQGNIRPGDMFIANDPYHGGGSHLPDLNIVAPVFHHGELEAYVASIAHHSDIGGMVPGSTSSRATSIFQEGLRLPPVKIMSEGRIVQDVFDIILLNSRTPDERSGDIRAQFVANTIGVRGVTSLLDLYGADTVREASAAYLDFTERRFAAAIDALNPGKYHAEDFLNGDSEGALAAIRLSLTVGSGTLDFDFSGSAPTLKNACNIPYQALIATIYTVVKSMLDPDIPANSGYFRRISAKAPKGTLVGPAEPAAVGARSASCGVLGDVVAAALSQAVPKAALAASGPHMLVVFSGTDRRRDTFFVNVETLAGGMGARPTHDGIDAVRVHGSGSSNLPVEVLETAYPLRVERYALRPGSGGAGQFRGGLGVVRDYRALDYVHVTLNAARMLAPASGLKGAGSGAPGRFVLHPETEHERELGSEEHTLVMERDTVLRVLTPGGGGFGIPQQRAADDVARDVREKRIAVEDAPDPEQSRNG